MPQLRACRFELAPDAPDSAGPGIATERVDHRASHATFSKGFELDTAFFVESVRGVDQPDHAVLDEVPEVDRVRHGRRHASCQGLDERQASRDTVVILAVEYVSFHDCGRLRYLLSRRRVFPN